MIWKKTLTQAAARRSFLTGAVITFLLPLLFSNASPEIVRLLDGLFDVFPRVSGMAQVSAFPQAVFIGAAGVLGCSAVVTALAWTSEGFRERFRKAAQHMSIGKRLLAGAVAVFMLLFPWFAPYKHAAGTWSAPISKLIAESPIALGVYFCALYIVSVGSLLFALMVFSGEGKK